LQVTEQTVSEKNNRKIKNINILDKTVQYQTNWFHHMERMYKRFAKNFTSLHQKVEEVDHTNDRRNNSELTLEPEQSNKTNPCG
jgi:hypothetical protein